MPCPVLAYSGTDFGDFAFSSFGAMSADGQLSFYVDWDQLKILSYDIADTATVHRATVFDIGSGGEFLVHVACDADDGLYSIVFEPDISATHHRWKFVKLIRPGPAYTVLYQQDMPKSENQAGPNMDPFYWGQPIHHPSTPGLIWLWETLSSGASVEREARMLGIDKDTGNIEQNVAFPYPEADMPIMEVGTWPTTPDGHIWIPGSAAGAPINIFDVVGGNWNQIDPLGASESIFREQLIPDADGSSVVGTLRSGVSSPGRGLVRIALDGSVTDLGCEPEFDNSTSASRDETVRTYQYGAWRWDESGTFLSIISSNGDLDEMYEWVLPVDEVPPSFIDPGPSSVRVYRYE